MLANLHNADIPRPVLDVLRRLRELGFAVYLVGGCVRDMVRGVAPKDFDVASSARPEQVQDAFKKVIPTGIQHGTVTVLMGGHHVEVTTFRSEGDYHDGRRPSSVSFETDINEDLSRRDFTINAMAYDPISRDLVDPFGGQADLQAHVIRCVRDAHERFSEDGLRALRAVRFAAVLGFTIEPATLAAIPPTIPVFRKVALERVREELLKTLLTPRAESGLTLLADTGLLDVFLPELARADAQAARLARAAAQAAPAEADLRVAALLTDLVTGPQAKELCIRLKFPTRSAELVGLLVTHARLEAQFTESDPALRRLLAKVGLGTLEPLLAVAHARIQVRAPQQVPGFLRLQERLRALAAAKPPLSAKELALTGGDIMATLGVGPSPAVGQATRFLMESVLDDPTLNEPERLKELLRTWQAGKGS